MWEVVIPYIAEGGEYKARLACAVLWTDELHSSFAVSNSVGIFPFFSRHETGLFLVSLGM